MTRFITLPGGTSVLVKDEEPVEAAKASWRSIIALAFIVFAYGFIFYVLLMLRTEGM